MAIQVCILGSGSSGNCTYVASEKTSLLIDAGLSGKETTRRLEQLKVDPGAIHGICVSHEHNDHTAGLRALQRKHGTPLYGNRGTIDALSRTPKFSELPWNVFSTGSAFIIGDLYIESFSVPHDAYEPVGFVIRSGSVHLGMAMDIGMPTTLIRKHLRSCQVVVVEANYDEGLLKEAPRPWHLKQRIMGRQGHLSNEHAAEMVSEIAGPHLKQVFLAHLSDECNRHDLALKIIRKYLLDSGHDYVNVSLTFPDRISEIWRQDEENERS